MSTAYRTGRSGSGHDPMSEGIGVGLGAEVDVVGHRIEPALARALRKPGRPLRPGDRPAIRHAQETIRSRVRAHSVGVSCFMGRG